MRPVRDPRGWAPLPRGDPRRLGRVRAFPGLPTGIEASDESLCSGDLAPGCAALALGEPRRLRWRSRAFSVCSARVGAARAPRALGEPRRLGWLRAVPWLSTGVEASDEPVCSENLASTCAALTRGDPLLGWRLRAFPVCSERVEVACDSRLWRMYLVAICAAVAPGEPLRLGGLPPFLLVRCSECVEATDDSPLCSGYRGSGSATLTRDGSRRIRRSPPVPLLRCSECVEVVDDSPLCSKYLVWCDTLSRDGSRRLGWLRLFPCCSRCMELEPVEDSALCRGYPASI